MEATTLSEARVYVGTYGKYNNGSLFGAWLNLSDYSDKEDLYEACRELHKDEEDAEYMFQDWENVPENLIGESWISENFFTLRDAVLPPVFHFSGEKLLFPELVRLDRLFRWFNWCIRSNTFVGSLGYRNGCPGR